MASKTSKWQTPEGRVKSEVGQTLNALGAYVFMPVQTGYGQRTIDYLCCVNGYFVGVECKRPGIYPTKFQELTCKRIVEAGGIAIAPCWNEQQIVDELRAKGVII